jgi:hypothetical protein
MTRRFPPPWSVEQIPGGFKVLTKKSARSELFGRDAPWGHERDLRPRHMNRKCLAALLGHVRVRITLSQSRRSGKRGEEGQGDDKILHWKCPLSVVGLWG